MASWSCLCSAVLGHGGGLLAPSLLLLKVFTTRFTIRFTIRFAIKFATRFTTRFTKGFTIRFTTKDPGTKILVTRSLGEPVLHDGGTALSAYPNRYPFFTVRTRQA